MIHEPAEVVAVRRGVVWADCQARRNCARCATGRGCGGALLGRLIGERQHRVRARCPDTDVKVGDTVRLELAEKTILGGALLAYFVPLTGLLAGAAGGDLLAGDPGALAGGACGLLLAWGGARIRSRRHGARLDPVARLR